MSFDVPVSIDILRVVDLVTSNLDLLETPLRQVDISSTKIAAEYDVLQSEGCSQSSNLGLVT